MCVYIYIYSLSLYIYIYIYILPVVQWLSSQDMDSTTRVQILDLADCSSHSPNTIGKGINPIILPPAMGK